MVIDGQNAGILFLFWLHNKNELLTFNTMMRHLHIVLADIQVSIALFSCVFLVCLSFLRKREYWCKTYDPMCLKSLQSKTLTVRSGMNC